MTNKPTSAFVRELKQAIVPYFRNAQHRSELSECLDNLARDVEKLEKRANPDFKTMPKLNARILAYGGSIHKMTSTKKGGQS